MQKSIYLFEKEKEESKWVSFSAEGFSQPVAGIIHRKDIPVTCGMPLGGITTGCIDLETSGLWGYCTIFNSRVPPRGPLNLPFLGLSVGKETWVLCDPKQTKPYGYLQNEYQPAFPIKPLQLDGVRTPQEIHYWGHYPVADIEYDTDAPVSVGLRAWAPFLPGHIEESLIPGAVFEVHLRNFSNSVQKGTVAFCFPGPTREEAGTDRFERHQVGWDAFNGVFIEAPKASYALGVIGKEQFRLGGDLGVNGAAWARISDGLPVDGFSRDGIPITGMNQAGASVAVDFELAPKEEKIVRFVLAWHSPQWNSGGYPAASKGNLFTHMYAKYYPSALETAHTLALKHESLLKRILAWQQALFTDETLPGWLAEVLINNFHLITEVGMWAQAKPPLGDWCREEDGLWALNECPRGCPQLECGGNSYYGGPAVSLFFPDLTRSTLRGYKAYQYPDGCATWIFGGCTADTPPCEMTMPTRGYQVGQTGSFHVGMIARYWAQSGDDKFLEEFYPYVKKATLYTFNLNPERPYGLISLPEFDQQESFESTPFKGMSAHVGIIRLYHLKMAEKMAKRMGDTEFAHQCREWFDQASQLLEKHLWTGSYYMQHTDPSTKETADVVMAYQLDGEFMAWMDGLGEGILPPERVRTTLATLKKVTMMTWGPRVWSNPDGSPPDFPTGYWTPCGVHSPSALMLAMTYMYHGEKEFGLELARKVMENMVCNNSWSWDMPILYRGDNGKGIWGNDYGQMMMPWALAAAMQGKDLSALTASGQLVDRLIKAGK